MLSGPLVFLDFEATSRDTSRAEPIELAALEVRDGAVTRRLVSLIRPRGGVPAEVTRLTGITPEMLDDAPAAAAVAERIARFLGNYPIVAHNADYDGALLEKLLGRPLAQPLLDSCELACLLRPDLEAHGLGALRSAFGLGVEGSHRAESDAEATLVVVRRLLEDPVARIAAGVALPILEGSRWPWLSILEGAVAGRALEPEPMAPRIAQRSLPGTVDSFFAPGGPLARALPGFEPRQAQLKMAREVARAFERGEHALIEAGTGVGKSLGYLVPLVRHGLGQREPVVVSTASKGLQDQLDRSDLPLLARALGGGVRWQVVKGQTNYLCARRLTELLLDSPEDGDPGDPVALAALAAFGAVHPEGDLELLSYYMLRRHPQLGSYRERVRSRGCVDTEGHDRCAASRVASRAAEVDVVVVNHSLLITGSRAVPEHRHLVVDEAHLLEDRASAALARGVDRRGLLELARRASLVGGRRAVRRSRPAWRTALADAAGGLEDAVRQVEAWGARIRGLASEGRALEHLELPLERVRELDAGGLKAAAGAIRGALERLRRALEARTGVPALRATEREDLRDHVAGALQDLEHVLGEESRGEVRFAELSAASFGLRAVPIDLAGEIRERVFDRRRSVIVTSATIAAGDDGRYLRQRIGYPTTRARPFFRAGAGWEASAAVPLAIDELAGVNEPEARARDLASILERVARALGGRTLALFASAARRGQVAGALRQRLEGTGIEVLEQGRDGSLPSLVARMREDRGTILLGCHSFWHGVDIPGPALSCVVLERIPFASQDRPLIAARMERHGGGFSGFTDYLLPTALMELRQGAGRLLRTRSDRGLVILCHEGLASKSYRRRVEAALPGGGLRMVRIGELEDAVREAARELAIELPAGPSSDDVSPRPHLQSLGKPE
jgi:ATP-dependent DNA helicase DinG